jgi:hypothetical protein
MEDVGQWHHGVPTTPSTARAMAELDARLAALGGEAA